MTLVRLSLRLFIPVAAENALVYANEEQLEGENDGHKSESSSENESAPEVDTSSLKEAIQTASVARIRSLLTLICKTNELAEEIANDSLLASMEDSLDKKRKKFENCKNCGEEYDVEQNDKGDCVYRSGKFAHYFD